MKPKVQIRRGTTWLKDSLVPVLPGLPGMLLAWQVYCRADRGTGDVIYLDNGVNLHVSKEEAESTIRNYYAKEVPSYWVRDMGTNTRWLGGQLAMGVKAWKAFQQLRKYGLVVAPIWYYRVASGVAWDGFTNVSYGGAICLGGNYGPRTNMHDIEVSRWVPFSGHIPGHEVAFELPEEYLEETGVLLTAVEKVLTTRKRTDQEAIGITASLLAREPWFGWRLNGRWGRFVWDMAPKGGKKSIRSAKVVPKDRWPQLVDDLLPSSVTTTKRPVW